MKRKRVHTLLLLSLPTVVLALAALLLMLWRVPTRIQVDLAVERATLTVGNSEPMSSRILNSVDFQAITFENFMSCGRSFSGVCLDRPRVERPKGFYQEKG
jgi:hypothetical protein